MNIIMTRTSTTLMIMITMSNTGLGEGSLGCEKGESKGLSAYSIDVRVTEVSLVVSCERVLLPNQRRVLSEQPQPACDVYVGDILARAIIPLNRA